MPITVQHPKNLTIADVGSTNIVQPSDWNSVHNITFTPAASEIQGLIQVSGELSRSTDANGITIYENAVYDEFFEPFVMPNTNSTLSAPGIGTWYLDPVVIPNDIKNGVFYLPVVGGVSTNFCQDGAVWSATLSGSNTRYATHINALALYKRGSGASTSRLETVWSNQMSAMMTWERRHSGTTTSNATISNYLTVSVPLNFDTNGGITYTTNAASGTVSYAVSTGASTLASSLITGPARYFTGSRMEFVPMASTLPPGDYILGHMFSSSTSVTGTNYTAGTFFTTQSRLGLLENNMGAFKRIGSSTTDATSSPQVFHGYLATTTLSATSIINTSDVRSTTGRAYWNFAQTTF